MRNAWVVVLVLVLTGCGLPLPLPGRDTGASSSPSGTTAPAPRWTFDTTEFAEDASPSATVVDDTVVLASKTAMVALSARNGKQLWRHRIDPPLQRVRVADD